MYKIIGLLTEGKIKFIKLHENDLMSVVDDINDATFFNGMNCLYSLDYYMNKVREGYKHSELMVITLERCGFKNLFKDQIISDEDLDKEALITILSGYTE